MSLKSMRRSADNRATTARSRIASTASPYERLRHALEWVMSEARAAGRDTTQDAVETITKVARELNERSRP